MSYASEIVTVLTADPTLMSILTGNVLNFPDSGRKGLTRTQVADAYDPIVGLLKPIAIVLEANEAADGQAVDGAGVYMSTQTPISIYVYDHGDSGYGQIELAYNRIYTLLHGQQIPGAFKVYWQSTLRDRREKNLKDACYYRIDFRVYGYRRNT